MPNRIDHLFDDDRSAGPLPQRSQQALERARADLSRMARHSQRAEPAAAPAAEAEQAVTVIEDGSAIAARIDLLRGRLGKAREDTVSALLFFSDAQQDCDALAESCDAAGWAVLAEGVGLLSAALDRALPAEPRHMDLIGLLIDALYALRRAETRPDMAQAGHDLLRGLRRAMARELGNQIS